MGQNSSFHLSITDVIRDWVPIAKDSSIFINRNTRHHLQRFIVQVSLPELLREVTIYNARIQATYPFVCKVAYFNQVPSDDDSKGFRSFAVYTDHLMGIREGDWTRMRFTEAVEAVLTLIGYYGFFRLTEGMMGVNQRGETKVWISDNPANNHRDCVFTTEKQAVAAFVALAARRNSQVASLLVNCSSLQQVKERLTRSQRKTSSPFENMGRTINEEREIPRKDYKNVFHEEDNAETKNYESKFMLPASTLFSNGRNKDQLKPSSYGGNNQSALSGRTISQYKKASKPTGSQFFKPRPQSKKIGQTSFDNFSKLPKHAATFDSIPHFQTANDFTNKFQIPSPTNKPHVKPQQPFVPDITIINNNVSHVVNNITHNHSAWNNLRHARTPEFAGESRNESVSPLGRRQPREKLSAPKFIQQRKQTDANKQNIQSFYANNSEKSSGILNTPKAFFNGPVSFNSTHGSNNNTEEAFKNAEMEWKMQPTGRKPQKLYTFCRPNNAKSPPKPFSTSFSPHAHPPFTPPATIQTAKTNHSFFKKPSRTLTTQFNEPPPKMPSGLTSSNNKSFTIDRRTDKPQKSFLFQNERSMQSIKPFKEKIIFNQVIPEDVAEALPTSKSIALNSPTSGKSIENSLKNQLKLQFSSLLGSEPKLQRKETSAMQTPPENNLKEKIQQKKMAFAELKKEALAVLTDIL